MPIGFEAPAGAVPHELVAREEKRRLVLVLGAFVTTLVLIADPVAMLSLGMVRFVPAPNPPPGTYTELLAWASIALSLKPLGGWTL